MALPDHEARAGRVGATGIDGLPLAGGRGAGSANADRLRGGGRGKGGKGKGLLLREARAAGRRGLLQRRRLGSDRGSVWSRGTREGGAAQEEGGQQQNGADVHQVSFPEPCRAPSLKQTVLAVLSGETGGCRRGSTRQTEPLDHPDRGAILRVDDADDAVLPPDGEGMS